MFLAGQPALTPNTFGAGWTVENSVTTDPENIATENRPGTTEPTPTELQRIRPMGRCGMCKADEFRPQRGHVTVAQGKRSAALGLGQHTDIAACKAASMVRPSPRADAETATTMVLGPNGATSP